MTNEQKNIKLNQNRMKTEDLTEANKITYTFYKELEEQSSYLRNLKIGSLKKFSQHKTTSPSHTLSKAIAFISLCVATPTLTSLNRYSVYGSE